MMEALAKYSLLAVILAVISMVSSWSMSVAATLVVWTILGGHYTLYLTYHTLFRDLRIAYVILAILYKNTGFRFRNASVGEVFEKTASARPDKTMIVVCSDNGDTTITFREAQIKSRQIARYFQSRGFGKGDVVALLMETRVDYPCYWLGLSMIGVIPTLVNCNLRDQSLLHSLTIVNSKAVIFSKDLQSAVHDIHEQLGSIPLYHVDQCDLPDCTNLTAELSTVPSTPIPEKHAGYTDKLFYVYTSGTTGLPKAATIKHSRCMFTTYALFSGCILSDLDVIYAPLPFYHTAAGVMTVGAALLEGVTVVTRKKFSASQYWTDCCRHNVTIGQYIGEIARYLYATKEGKDDRRHNVKKMFGNGLRPDIWQGFTDRFAIKQICEFYGATEGNCSTANVTGKVGAVGFISVLFPYMFPMCLLKVDKETRVPLRDSRGLCIPCKTGEPGELVGRIERGHPVRDFHGYADNSATSKKIVVDVWKKGDMCFRTGDILVMDKFGWLYFKDRAGDTFRWKGENVSTTEVEAVISNILGLKAVVVYGVQIPGTEGRAGMAAITVDSTTDQNRTIDLKRLYQDLTKKLPAYARPIFLRIVESIDTTSTHKLKKRDLQSEGFDLSVVSEPVFVMDPLTQDYVPIQDQYTNICNGNIRF